MFGRLRRLADRRLPKPLISLSGTHGHMGEAEVSLTPFGAEVLEGNVSQYPTNPIEDWAAGVRLSSAAGRVWFNDRGKVTRA